MVRTSFSPVAASLLATALVAVSVLAQRAEPQKDFKFEVCSIKPLAADRAPGITFPTPNGFSTSAFLWQLVVFAYGPPFPLSNLALSASTEVRNLPNWAPHQPYAIDARVSQSDLTARQNQKPNYNLLRSAVRAVLKERFKLAIHEEPAQREMNELVVSKRGPKFKASAPGATLPKGVALESGGVMTFLNNGADGFIFHGATMQDLAVMLNNNTPAVPVRDHTGLTGRYDFTLRRAPAVEGEPPSYDFAELGLQMKPGNENRPILVIDHVEKPTAN